MPAPILQLDPPIWMETPRGLGLAMFLQDTGVEGNMTWGVGITEGSHAGEIWWVENPEVRLCKNWTIGRREVTSRVPGPPSVKDMLSTMVQPRRGVSSDAP